MSTTINKDEIQKFSGLAEEWWDVNGKFKPLHMFNPIRIEYILENIKKHYKIKNDTTNLIIASSKVHMHREVQIHQIQKVSQLDQHLLYHVHKLFLINVSFQNLQDL